MDNPFSRFRFGLLGMTVSNIWHGRGSAIFLEFGRLTSRKRLDGSKGEPWGEFSIGLEFDWRIELGRAIVCGSGGNRELWDAHFERMAGATVIELSLQGIVPELSLELSTGHRLLTYSLYEGGPDWALTDRRESAALWVSFKNGQFVEVTS